RRRCRGRSGSPPQLRINSPLLGESLIESCRVLLGPGSREVIEVVMKLVVGGGPLPRRLFQHANHRFVETQPVLARAPTDGLLELGGDVTQGYGGHRELLPCVRWLHHSTQHNASYHRFSASTAASKHRVVLRRGDYPDPFRAGLPAVFLRRHLALHLLQRRVE